MSGGPVDMLRYSSSTRGRPRPRWTHPTAYISRQLPQAIATALNYCVLPPSATVLDFGCAHQPYRELFSLEVDYIGADLPGNELAHMHVQADGSLPVKADKVDLVLSSQVLEHVVDPLAYLAEAYRVLRPGGTLVLSTHGIMIYHPDPVDYWRWTGEGLQKIVVDTGFEVTRFEGVMGLAATGLQLFQDATWGNLPRWLRRPYAGMMQMIIALCDRLYSPAGRRNNALVFVLCARKPE